MHRPTLVSLWGLSEPDYNHAPGNTERGTCIAGAYYDATAWVCKLCPAGTCRQGGRGGLKGERALIRGPGETVRA